MKTIVTLFALSLLCFTAKAQETKEPKKTTDTTEIKFGEDAKLLYIKDKSSSDGDTYASTDSKGDILIGTRKKGRKSRNTFWTGIDMGFNFMADANGNTTIPENTTWQTDPIKSMYWGINLLKAETRLFGNHYIMTGLGFNYRSFTPNEFYDISTTEDTTFFGPTTILNPKKNKLRVTYVQVPFLLNFNTSRNYQKNVHIAVGVLANVRIGSIYKQKYKLNGSLQKDRQQDDFNLNPIAADWTVRLGFGSFTLFANYAITNMFEEGATTQLKPFSVGLQLVGF